MRAERRAREPGAAAEIEHGAEALPMFRHRLAQQRRRRIGEVRERAVEARRVLVEQRAHVAVQGLRRRVGAAEPRKAQRRAMAVVGVGGRGALERGARALPVTERLARFAERKPGRCEPGRKFRRLRIQVGGGREIALGRVAARHLVAAVGDQVAGGDEQRHVVPGLAMRPIWHI